MCMFSLALACGCASFEERGEAPNVKAVPVLCTNNVDPASSIGLLPWELEVVPGSIESGRSFEAELDGVMVFNEDFLDAGQDLIPGGVLEVNLVDARATVHVRRGANGKDLTLEVAPIPYRCATGGSLCDPANDLDGVAGLRGNTDCEPVGPTNACGRYVLLPTSTECEPGGICALRGKLEQCALNGFCVTGDLRVALQSAYERYTADDEGEVLFGWDDESTGATLEPEGSDDAIWVLPPAVYTEPTGPLGLRLVVGPVPVAFECTMGVFNADLIPPQPIPAPDDALIAFPIETFP